MLKRIYLFSAMCLFVLGTVSAQTLSLGPIVGVNIMTISNTLSSKEMIGLSAGAFGNYSINEHVGVNGKLLFSQMGTAFENTDYTVRLNYIQLPVSAVYFFGNSGNKLRPKVFAGPYVAFLMSAKDNNSNDIALPNGDDIYLKTDFGGLLGVGFNYLVISRTWLNLDASYSSSFSSIVDASASTNRNTGFQINAGVSFPIGE